MDKKVKAQWVKALCSGDYKQGHGALRADDKFCCLGVLCDVTDYRLDGSGGCESSGYGHVRKWLSGDELHALFRLNDDGVPFDMIAGLIDEAL